MGIKDAIKNLKDKMHLSLGGEYVIPESVDYIDTETEDNNQNASSGNEGNKNQESNKQVEPKKIEIKDIKYRCTHVYKKIAPLVYTRYLWKKFVPLDTVVKDIHRMGLVEGKKYYIRYIYEIETKDNKKIEAWVEAIVERSSEGKYTVKASCLPTDKMDPNAIILYPGPILYIFGWRLIEGINPYNHMLPSAAVLTSSFKRVYIIKTQSGEYSKTIEVSKGSENKNESKNKTGENESNKNKSNENKSNTNKPNKNESNKNKTGENKSNTNQNKTNQ